MNFIANLNYRNAELTSIPLLSEITNRFTAQGIEFSIDPSSPAYHLSVFHIYVTILNSTLVFFLVKVQWRFPGCLDQFQIEPAINCSLAIHAPILTKTSLYSNRFPLLDCERKYR